MSKITPTRYSRVDIYLMACRAGLRDADANDLSHELSPECRGVPSTKVLRAIAKRVEELSK
jgi:hypothetical protein